MAGCGNPSAPSDHAKWSILSTCCLVAAHRRTYRLYSGNSQDSASRSPKDSKGWWDQSSIGGCYLAWDLWYWSLLWGRDLSGIGDRVPWQRWGGERWGLHERIWKASLFQLLLLLPMSARSEWLMVLLWEGTPKAPAPPWRLMASLGPKYSDWWCIF